MANAMTIHLAGGIQLQARVSWDSHRQRHYVHGGQLTKTLGYIYTVALDAGGNVIPRQEIWTPVDQKTIASRHVYQATDTDGTKLGDPTATKEEAAAFIVGHAHSQDPAPEHILPR